MRYLRWLGPLAALATVAAALVLAAQETVIKVIPVAGAVSMLEGRGGNIGVLAGDDGLLMVDDQYPDLAEQIQAALDGLGMGSLQYLLNTHWHGDHVGGNGFFGPLVPVVAHANVRARMQAGSAQREIGPAAAAALPDITFQESMTIHFNDEEIVLRHFPQAHTDGDTAVFFTGSAVAHLGDLFFNGRFPYIDLDSGGSVRGLVQAVQKLLAELADDVQIIPGHGPVATRSDFQRYHDMLQASVEHVTAEIAAGQTVEEVVAAGLPEFDDWAWQFISTERWLRLLYGSLSRSP